jgi:hypothetical protein
MGSYILTNFQTEQIMLNPSKVSVTELGASGSTANTPQRATNNFAWKVENRDKKKQKKAK